ncbi:unnamed protein product [Pleuronectes platessa]|uniref:Uncharacterized protein n=1 Tax=Pleuronectes platessa TaxID=8262 RepID=A0A9N7Z9V7_PLEPL|nr:unnamed protein product [Pleuronectes platessa]
MSEGEAKVLSSCFLTSERTCEKHSDEKKKTRLPLHRASVPVLIRLTCAVKPPTPLYRISTTDIRSRDLHRLLRRSSAVLQSMSMQPPGDNRPTAGTGDSSHPPTTDPIRHRMHVLWQTRETGRDSSSGDTIKTLDVPTNGLPHGGRSGSRLCSYGTCNPGAAFEGLEALAHLEEPQRWLSFSRPQTFSWAGKRSVIGNQAELRERLLS